MSCHYRETYGNGGHIYECDGTVWLYPHVCTANKLLTKTVLHR